MKLQWLLMVCCSSFLSFGYVKKTTWIEAQKKGQVPANLKKQLDDFFAQAPDLKAVLLSKKPVYPSTYQVVPNRHFGGTFDPKMHVWQQRPAAGKCICLGADSNEEKPEIDKGDTAKQVFDEHAVTILKKHGIYSWSSRNFIIPLTHKGIPFMLQALGTEEQVYPLQLSRYLGARALENYCVTHNYTHIKVPKTYLYYMGQRADQLPKQELIEEEWVIVQEHIQNVVSLALLKNKFVFMDTVYALTHDEVSASEKKAALKQGSRLKKRDYNKLLPADVRKKTICQWQEGSLSQEEIDNAIELIEQMDQFLGDGKGVYWDALIHRLEKDSDALRGANFVLQEDKQGLFTVYIIDCEMPFRRGNKEDERVCVDFTGDDTLQIHRNYPIAYYFLRTPCLKDMHESLLQDLPELVHEYALEELAQCSALSSSEVHAVAESLKKRIELEVVPPYKKRLSESERVARK